MRQTGSNVPHVRGRLDRGDKLESNVCKADKGDDGSRDVGIPLVTDQDAAEEEVDWCAVSYDAHVPALRYSHFRNANDILVLGGNVQTPRPIKLNMKEAYLAT